MMLSSTTVRCLKAYTKLWCKNNTSKLNSKKALNWRIVFYVILSYHQNIKRTTETLKIAVPQTSNPSPTMTTSSASTFSGGMAYTERVKNKRIIKPIIYGNKATLLPQKTKENHTHRWTLYVKAYDSEEDLSLYIRKVQFRLHESYANCVRIVEKPPFEITETGWGEFDAQIKMYFVDVNEKPVTAFHYIRLHQPVMVMKTGQEMVLKEHYDEIVFNEPTEPMYRALLKFNNYKKSALFEHAKQQLKELLEAENRKIVTEIEDLKQTLKDGCELSRNYRHELTELGGDEKMDED